MVFQDIGQQLLTDGVYVTPEEICARIDAVTPEDIQRVVAMALDQNPSLACIGEDIRGVPSHEVICGWFRQYLQKGHDRQP